MYQNIAALSLNKLSEELDRVIGDTIDISDFNEREKQYAINIASAFLDKSEKIESGSKKEIQLVVALFSFENEDEDERASLSYSLLKKSGHMCENLSELPIEKITTELDLAIGDKDHMTDMDNVDKLYAADLAFELVKRGKFGDLQGKTFIQTMIGLSCIQDQKQKTASFYAFYQKAGVSLLIFDQFEKPVLSAVKNLSQKIVFDEVWFQSSWDIEEKQIEAFLQQTATDLAEAFGVAPPKVTISNRSFSKGNDLYLNRKFLETPKKALRALAHEFLHNYVERHVDEEPEDKRLLRISQYKGVYFDLKESCDLYCMQIAEVVTNIFQHIFIEAVESERKGFLGVSGWYQYCVYNALNERAALDMISFESGVITPKFSVELENLYLEDEEWTREQFARTYVDNFFPNEAKKNNQSALVF